MELRARAAACLTAGLVACGGGSPEDDASTPATAPGAPRAEEAAEGTSAATRPRQLFTDVTEASGVAFAQGTGANGRWILTEIMGGGGALFDADGDDDLDLLLLQGGADSASPASAQAGSGHALYRNDGTGRFEDVSDGAGLDGLIGYAMGVATGDVDADGDVDLFVTQHGRDALFLNDGSGRFTDATEEWNAGVTGWSTSATFGDLDGDGDLDLFVTRYIELDPELVCNDAAGRRTYCPPASGPAVHDVILLNEGNRFVDASERIGLTATPQPGLGVVLEDLSGDGTCDVYVANDGQANQLWVRQPDGTWRDESLARGIALNQNGYAEASMGVVAEDFDGDGLVDLFMTHLQEETHTLYRARRAGAFRDGTGRAGLNVPTRPMTGFGVAAFDVELDGDIDLAVANGRVRIGPVHGGCELTGAWARLAEQNSFLVNDGGSFTDGVTRAQAFTGPILVDRCVLQGDIDGDGDIDIVVTGNEAPARVLRNDAERAGTWITIDPVAEEGACTTLGARVAVRAGDFALARTTRSSDGYQSSRDPRAHFGVPADAMSVDVVVTWPDGTAEAFRGLAPESVHVALRDVGETR
ncbi:MAG: CRTAC1 family protein [Planctomycetota bacterium]